MNDLYKHHLVKEKIHQLIQSHSFPVCLLFSNFSVAFATLVCITVEMFCFDLWLHPCEKKRWKIQYMNQYMVLHQNFPLWIETNECGQLLSPFSLQAVAAFVSALSALSQYLHILYAVTYLLCQVIHFPVWNHWMKWNNAIGRETYNYRYNSFGERPIP